MSTKVNGPCSVQGCKRGGPLVKGTCRVHYYRFKKHGSYRETRTVNADCSVAGCGDKATRKHLCGKHYTRLLLKGTTADPIKAMPKICLVEGCGRRTKARGYCCNHSERIKKYGDPLAQHPRFKVDGKRLEHSLCAHCGKPVPPDFYFSNVCSHRCYHRHRKGRPLTIGCAICGSHFEPNSGRVTCSALCAVARKQQTLATWNSDQQLANPLYNERRRLAQQRRRAKMLEAPVEKFLYREIAEHNGWLCRLCGEAVDQSVKHPHKMSGTIDHIIPLARGGPHTKANVQLAHRICNMRKSDRLHLNEKAGYRRPYSRKATTTHSIQSPAE